MTSAMQTSVNTSQPGPVGVDRGEKKAPPRTGKDSPQFKEVIRTSSQEKGENRTDLAAEKPNKEPGAAEKAEGAKKKHGSAENAAVNNKEPASKDKQEFPKSGKSQSALPNSGAGRDFLLTGVKKNRHQNMAGSSAEGSFAPASAEAQDSVLLRDKGEAEANLSAKFSPTQSDDRPSKLSTLIAPSNPAAEKSDAKSRLHNLLERKAASQASATLSPSQAAIDKSAGNTAIDPLQRFADEAPRHVQLPANAKHADKPITIDAVKSEAHFRPAVSAGMNPNPGAGPAEQISKAIFSELGELKSAQSDRTDLSRSSSPTEQPGGNDKLRILNFRLHPANLGTVKIILRLAGEGLEVRLEAQNPRTTEILANNRAMLENLLRNAGLRSDSLSFATVVDKPAIIPALSTGMSGNMAAGNQQEEGNAMANQGERFAGNQQGNQSQSPAQQPEDSRNDREDSNPDPTANSDKGHQAKNVQGKVVQGEIGARRVYL